MSTKRGGFCAPSVLLSEQQICNLVDSFLTLNISNDNIEDGKNFLSGVTNFEHTKCSWTSHFEKRKCEFGWSNTGSYAEYCAAQFVLLKWSNYRRESITNPSMITSGKDVTVGESFGDELRLSVNCTDELSYIPGEIFLENTFTSNTESIT